MRSEPYLSFSKKELNGIIILCTGMMLLGFFPEMYTYFHPEKEVASDRFQRDIALFESSVAIAHPYTGWGGKRITASPVKYFKFDPNLIGPEAWKKLGISDASAKTIGNYLSKKGHFYRKEDLKKIYSITAADYNRLEPYISIAETKDRRYPEPVKKEVKQRPLTDLNQADSAALDSLSGIGPAFASRILKYREKLGGFYEKEQLREVYGIDSEKYEQVEKQVLVNPGVIKKININIAVFDDLKRFPYLSYKQINSILQYRKQHGSYKAPEDLLKTELISPALLNKIIPYLSF